MSRLLVVLLLVSLAFAGGQRADTEDVARRAVEAERQGDFARAVPLFLQLIHDGADSAALRTNLGIAYFQLKQFDKALHQFRVSLGSAPKSVQANLFAGLTLLNLQRPKEALRFLKAAHLADPHDGVVVLAFARAEFASNDLAAARTFYEKATRLDAQNAEAWYGLGITERILAERELKAWSRSGEGNAKAEGARTLLEASGKAVARAMQLDPISVLYAGGSFWANPFELRNATIWLFRNIPQR